MCNTSIAAPRRYDDRIEAIDAREFVHRRRLFMELLASQVQREIRSDREARHRRWPVRCVNSHRTFVTIGAAARASGLDARDVKRSLLSGKPVQGLKFRRVNLRTLRRAVLCRNSGEIWPTAVAAERALRLHRNAVGNAVRRGRRAGGYSWTHYAFGSRFLKAIKRWRIR